MIEQLIIISALAVFIDLLLWKWKVWPHLSALSRGGLMNKAINCELCRSWWLVVTMFVVWVILGHSIELHDIVLLPVATVLKLYVQGAIERP